MAKIYMGGKRVYVSKANYEKYKAGQMSKEEASGKSTAENKPKATHAWNVEDMNETQLEREIAKYERWTNASQKAVNNVKNSASMRNFEELMDQFPRRRWW